jgi:hypothetical protein
VRRRRRRRRRRSGIEEMGSERSVAKGSSGGAQKQVSPT